MATPKRNPNVPFWAIYLLIDPRVDHPVKRIRYVGWTTRPKYRLKMHKAVARGCKVRGRSHLYAWLRALHRAGCEPIMQIIESGSGDAWLRVEPGWIAFYRRIGAPLVNQSSGGDGCPGVVPSAETRAKLSAKFKGRQISEQQKIAISAANKGRKHTDEARAKMSASGRGKKHSAAHNAAISAAHNAKGIRPRLTPEQLAAKALRRKGTKGKPHTAESKAKLSAARKGRPLSPAQLAAAQNRGAEWREKLRQAARKRLEKPEYRQALTMATAAAAARVRPDEERARRAASRRGKKHSAETRAKMSAAKKGRLLSTAEIAARRNKSAECRAKLSATHKALATTPEGREKKRLAALKGWASRKNPKCSREKIE